MPEYIIVFLGWFSPRNTRLENTPRNHKQRSCYSGSMLLRADLWTAMRKTSNIIIIIIIINIIIIIIFTHPLPAPAWRVAWRPSSLRPYWRVHLSRIHDATRRARTPASSTGRSAHADSDTGPTATAKSSIGELQFTDRSTLFSELRPRKHESRWALHVCQFTFVRKKNHLYQPLTTMTLLEFVKKKQRNNPDLEHPFNRSTHTLCRKFALSSPTKILWRVWSSMLAIPRPSCHREVPRFTLFPTQISFSFSLRGIFCSFFPTSNLDSNAPSEAIRFAIPSHLTDVFAFQRTSIALRPSLHSM